MTHAGTAADRLRAIVSAETDRWVDTKAYIYRTPTAVRDLLAEHDAVVAERDALAAEVKRLRKAISRISGDA